MTATAYTNSADSATVKITSANIGTLIAKLGSRNYVSPVTPFQLGRKALRFGQTPHPAWPQEVRRGWEFEGARCEGQSLAQDGTF